MTDIERNELVEKLAKQFFPATSEEMAGIRETATWYLRSIESLGYEIVKKEEFDKYKKAFVEKQFVVKKMIEKVEAANSKAFSESIEKAKSEWGKPNSPAAPTS